MRRLAEIFRSRRRETSQAAPGEGFSWAAHETLFWARVPILYGNLKEELALESAVNAVDGALERLARFDEFCGAIDVASRTLAPPYQPLDDPDLAHDDDKAQVYRARVGEFEAYVLRLSEQKVLVGLLVLRDGEPLEALLKLALESMPEVDGEDGR